VGKRGESPGIAKTHLTLLNNTDYWMTWNLSYPTCALPKLSLTLLM